MVADLGNYFPGGETKIILPASINGVAVSLRNSTGSIMDGIVVRLEEQQLLGQEENEDLRRPQDQISSNIGRDEVSKDLEGELARNIDFEIKAYVGGKQIVAKNTRYAKPEGLPAPSTAEATLQFPPVNPGQTFDMDLSLARPATREIELTFVVVPTRNQKVIMEAQTPTRLRSRLVSYTAMFLIAEFLVFAPTLGPQTRLGGLGLIPALIGINMMVLISLAIFIDRFIPKPNIIKTMHHLIVFVLTAMTAAIILGLVKISDSIATQFLLTYGAIIVIYLTAMAVSDYLRTRRATNALA